MDDVQKLLSILPSGTEAYITDPDNLTEIVLDLGRPIILRYKDRKKKLDVVFTQEMLDEALNKIGVFGPDNRAGVDGTLHRISRVVNRIKQTIGLTCRVARPYYGSIAIIEDLILAGHNVLLLGPPGLGKTTKLREIARRLAEEDLRVVIVDTSNEIAGDGNVPHPAVGESRRLQVPIDPAINQADVMIEAVENHTPQVIVIDEISTFAEAMAARTIAQRGVQLVATAHGNKLEDLISNPPLCSLIGGIKSVTISDEKADQLGTSKTRLNREHEPTFDVIVELIDFDEVAIHSNVKEVVDCHLDGGYIRPEERYLTEEGEIVVSRQAKIVFPVKEDYSNHKSNGRLSPKNGKSRRHA